MHFTTGCCVFVVFLIIQQAMLAPLTVVPDKSGEQQVKEALKKAEQEAEKAAKEGNRDSKEGSSSSTRSTEGTQLRLAQTQDNQDDSNKRMKAMAAKLNNLVVKFQKKVIANKLHNALQRRVAMTKAMQKGTQGKRAAAGQKSNFDLSNLDPLAAQNNAMSTPYKEDTRLEDRLALEAEEEKKFSNGETYDDGGDYHDSSMMKSYAGTTSLSPKEQASQEMQRYNALISSESSRELSQIQDEISKATQSSMGKVSVQGENPSVSAEQGNSNAGASQDLELGNLGGLTQSLGGLNSQSIGGLGGGLNSIGGLDGPSNGLNLGSQIESGGSSLTSTQGESFAGMNSDSQALQSLQNTPGLTNAGADTQANGLTPQTVDMSAGQHLFNKKSKISRNKKKAKRTQKQQKSKMQKHKE